MKLAEYARDKRALAHRVLSLVVAVSLLLIEGLGGPGFVPLRIVNGVYILPLMLIWFPEAFSGRGTGRSGPKGARIVGWILLMVVPLWFHALGWITG